MKSFIYVLMWITSALFYAVVILIMGTDNWGWDGWRCMLTISWCMIGLFFWCDISEDCYKKYPHSRFWYWSERVCLGLGRRTMVDNYMINYDGSGDYCLLKNNEKIYTGSCYDCYMRVYELGKDEDVLSGSAQTIKEAKAYWGFSINRY